MVQNARRRSRSRVHTDEKRSVAPLLEELRVVRPLVLHDPIAARVERLGEERVERPSLSGSMAVHDDDLGRAARASAPDDGVDLFGIELPPFLVERLATLDLLPFDDAGNALHVAHHDDAHFASLAPQIAQSCLSSETRLDRVALATAVSLNGEDLTVDDVWRVAVGGTRAELSDDAREKMDSARAVVERAASEASGEHTYGINTGFGRFVSRSIPPELSEELQLRLLRSHACGVGEPYPDEVVRAAMVLRANALAKGYSGARVETVELLLECLNRGVLPYVPARGSVGASGDLAPLAHLALPLVGEGWALLDGDRITGAEALRSCGPRAGPAASEGGALAHQRDAVHERDRLVGPRPGATPRQGCGHRLCPLGRGAPGFAGQLQAGDPGAPSAAGTVGVGRERHSARRGLGDHRVPPLVRQGPGCVLLTLCAPGSRCLQGSAGVRGADSRNRAERRHRQPARLRRERRAPVERQLPRSASGFRARRNGDGVGRARLHLGAPRRAAHEPIALGRAAGLLDP